MKKTMFKAKDVINKILICALILGMLCSSCLSVTAASAAPAKTTKEKLQEMVAHIDTLKEADYTAATWAPVKTLYTAIKANMDDDAKVAQFGEGWLAITQQKINELKRVEKEKTTKEKLEEILAHIDTLSESDYTAQTWSPVKILYTGIKTNINNDTMLTQYGGMWLTTIQEKIAGLVKVEKKPDHSTNIPEDGYYKIPIRGYNNFKRVKSSENNKHTYQNALLYVKGGKAELTVRFAAYQLYDVFVLNQKHMKEFEASGDLRHCPVNASKISNVHPWKSQWLKWRLLTETDNAYYLENDQVRVNADDDMAYADITFPIHDISLDTVLRAFPKANEASNERANAEWLLIDLDEARIEKLDPLPKAGNYTWYPVLEDGTKRYDSFANAAIANMLQGTFEDNANVTVSDGRASVEVQVKDTSTIKNVSVMTRRDQENVQSDSSVWKNVIKKKSINPDDYTSNYQNGSFSVDLNVSSYADLVFGKRIWVSAGSDKGDTDYYAGLIFTTKRPEQLTLSDTKTKISYTTTSRNVPSDSQIRVKAIDKKNSKYDMIKDFFSTGYKEFAAWDIGIIRNGSLASPTKNGTLKIPIPQGWNEKNLHIERYIEAYGQFEEMQHKVVDGFAVIETEYFGVYVLAEKSTFDTTGESLTDGTYTVNVASWNMLEDKTSMSSRGIDSPAKLVVKNKVKTLYLDFRAVGNMGMTSYMTMMRVYDKDVTYAQSGLPQGKTNGVLPYAYYKEKDGTFLTDDFNANSLKYYPKSVYFTLPSDNGEIPVRFSVPVMDLIAGKDSSQDARFRIDYSSAVRISNDTPDVPAKEALGEVIKIAETAVEEEYKEDTWTVLKRAYDAAKVVYSNNSASIEESTKAYTDLRASIDGLRKPDAVKMDDGLYTAAGTIRGANIVTGTRMLLSNETVSEKTTTTAEVYLNVTGIKGFAYFDTEQNTHVNAVLETDERNAVTRAKFTLRNLSNMVSIKYINNKNEALSGALMFSKFVKQDVNKAPLIEAIASANEKLAGAAQNPDKYEADKIPPLERALAAAMVVNDDAVAIQTEVDRQIEAVNIAINALSKTVSREALQSAVAKAEKISGDTYTPSSFKALTDAIAGAKDVLAKVDATAQALDAQILKLKAAQEGLVTRGDKSELQKVYDEGAAIINEGYVGWDDLQSVLAKARAVLEDENATPVQVRDQVNAIKNAVNNLEGGIDKSALITLITEAEKLDMSSYSAASVAYFRAVIASAKATANNAGATQQGIDKQLRLLQATSEALMQKVQDNVIYDGTYTIEGKMWHSAADQSSMGDVALVKPMQLIVATDKDSDTAVTLRMEFKALTTSLGNSKFTGYLAGLSYFPGWEGGSSGYELPKGQTPVGVNVESRYEGIYDIYNDPATGTDKIMKGKLYPHIMTMPIDLNDSEVWIQVYVPVMESLNTGSGTQYAKLQFDWSTLKLIKGVETDKKGLSELGKKAQALLDGLKEGDVGNTPENIEMLKLAIAMATDVEGSLNIDQKAVNATARALEAALSVFSVEEVKADKRQLKKAIDTANTHLNNQNVTYTETTRTILLTARDNGQKVYKNEQATQAQVNSAVKAIDNAIKSLQVSEEKPDNNNPEETLLDIKNLTDGVYSIGGSMVKIDKSAPSMSNEAINHNIKLNVSGGKHFITMSFKGLTVGSQLGYLGTLKYFKSGYILDKYGAPQGSLGDVKIESYQTYSDGTRVKDNFGTDYPNEVTFELIPEAMNDGLVPLQVFVPIMAAISPDSGTQPVFLKLALNTLKKASDEDKNFQNENTNHKTDNKEIKNQPASVLPSRGASLKPARPGGLGGGTGRSAGGARLASGAGKLAGGGAPKLSAASGFSGSGGTTLASAGSKASGENTSTKTSGESSNPASKAAIPTIISLFALALGIGCKCKSRKWTLG